MLLNREELMQSVTMPLLATRFERKTSNIGWRIRSK